MGKQMSDYETQMLQAVQKMSDLLELLAEDKIAQRDAKQRTTLLEIVGTSDAKQKSVFQMDGIRTQKEIRAKTSMNQGNLSTMVSMLHKAKLLAGDTNTPRLANSIPQNFFKSNAKTK